MFQIIIIITDINVNRNKNEADDIINSDKTIFLHYTETIFIVRN